MSSMSAAQTDVMVSAATAALFNYQGFPQIGSAGLPIAAQGALQAGLGAFVGYTAYEILSNTTGTGVKIFGKDSARWDVMVDCSIGAAIGYLLFPDNYALQAGIVFLSPMIRAKFVKTPPS